MNKIKEKLQNIWDDIVWYTTCWPKERYGDIKHWFRVCARFKTHWQLVSYSLFHCHPWDFEYFLELQYKWIKKSNQYFNKFDYCSEYKKYEINRYQNICIGLLEIMLDKRDFHEYDSENHQVIMKIPVNLKNKHRFPYIGIDPENGNNVYGCIDMYDRAPDEYYKNKAKYLYFRILRDYADNWWD